ncbi:MAG: glycosyltransferase [Athalassotoga sp.]
MRYWDHGALNGILRSKVRKFLFYRQIKNGIIKVDAHLAISTGIRDQILKIDPNAKVYTVFNPLDSYNGSLIQRSKTPIFLYFGRIDDSQKNISFLLSGMSRIKKDWKLIIIGTGRDENKLKSLSNVLGISQRIEWRGFQAVPYANLNEGITALLLTSKFEGLPMVLAEANQRGIPVISSDSQTGPSDIVIPGKNGYLYPEGNIGAFVKIINDIIDGKLRFDTPENISKTSEKFSKDKINENIINALREIISSSSNRSVTGK